MRESSKSLKNLDTRFRGYDGKSRPVQVQILNLMAVGLRLMPNPPGTGLIWGFRSDTRYNQRLNC